MVINMTKGEFLEELRMALQGNISQIQVNEHILYYERYIIEESRKGRTEEEVLHELGNPRLIAHTIIDTSENQGNNYDETYGNDTDELKQQKRLFKLNSRYGILSMILLILLVIIIIGFVIVFLIPVIVFLIPIIWVMFLIGVVMTLIKRGKGK